MSEDDRSPPMWRPTGAKASVRYAIVGDIDFLRGDLEDAPGPLIRRKIG